MGAREVTSAEPAQEEPWKIPEGWCWAKVSEAVEKVETAAPKEKFGKRVFQYIDLGAIQEGKIAKPRRLAGHDAPSRARQVVKAGDTVFSCVRVYLQNIAIVSEGLQSPIASTAFCVLRPSQAVDARYLNYFVRSQRFIDWLIPLQRGNSPPAVVESDVKRQSLPLAPISEQRRIVARVDALFAEIAEGEAALAVARNRLDTFHRTLLKAAVSGELTKDWREANRALETGYDVLARIAKSLPAKRSSKGRRAAAALLLETSALPKLPEGWAWGTLGEIAAAGPTNGYSPKISSDGSGTLALKLTATTKGRIDLSERAVKHLSETIRDDSDLFLEPGDLLFQRGNTIEYVGIAAVYEGPSRTYIYPDLMIRVRLNPEIAAEWVWRVANAPYGRKYMSDRATGTAGTMPKISGQVLRHFPIPIPPPTETAEILRRVSAALLAVDDTLALLEAEAADAARLKQSILKAAFEGRLVTQDPADEPAARLLARLAIRPTTTRARGGRPKPKTSKAKP